MKKSYTILICMTVLLLMAANVNAASKNKASTGTDSLYIGDGSDNTVKRFDANSGKFIDNFVSSTNGGLYGPRGILFDKNGNLLVTNQNVGQPFSGEILQYNGKTGAFEKASVANTSENAPFAPRGIILNNKKLYVADMGDSGRRGNVSSYNAQDGTFLGDLDPNAFTDPYLHPRGIVFGPDGHLYVSVVSLEPNPSPGGQPLGGQVLRFKPNGNFDKVFIADDGGADKLNRPEGLVFGPDRNLYITSFRADPNDKDSIRIYDGKTGEFLKKIDLYKVGEPRAYAQAIIFGPNGRLFVPISNTGEVRQYNITDGTYDSFVNAGGELINPWFLTFGKTDPKTLEYRS
jgi:glucose/arabinose dehydrogenase